MTRRPFTDDELLELSYILRSTPAGSTVGTSKRVAIKLIPDSEAREASEDITLVAICQLCMFYTDPVTPMNSICFFGKGKIEKPCMYSTRDDKISVIFQRVRRWKND